MPLIIREVTVHDLSKLDRFLREVLVESYTYIENGTLFHPAYMTQEDISGFVRDFTRSRTTYGLLASDDDEIVACIATRKVSQDTCELHSLYVKKEYRSRGLGTRMLKTMESRILPGTKLVLDVITQNTKAQKLYEKHGYRREGGAFDFRWQSWPAGKHVRMNHYSKQPFTTKPEWTIAYAVTDQYGRLIDGHSVDDRVETSSTIKTPLSYYFMRKLTQNRETLYSVMPILSHHRSNGSGIVNWTDWQQLPVHAVIDLTNIYSDCVTANMMIDYLGGKDVFNELLRRDGYGATELHKSTIQFESVEGSTEQVGSTTPAEAVQWVRALHDGHDIHPQFKAQHMQSTRNIDTPCFTHPRLVGNDLLIKTGSMIDEGGETDSVFNVTGSYNKSGQKRYFSFFSRGNLANTYANTEIAKTELSHRLADILL